MSLWPISVVNPKFDRFMHVYFVVVERNVPATTEIRSAEHIVSYQSNTYNFLHSLADPVSVKVLIDCDHRNYLQYPPEPVNDEWIKDDVGDVAYVSYDPSKMGFGSGGIVGVS